METNAPTPSVAGFPPNAIWEPFIGGLPPRCSILELVTPSSPSDSALSHLATEAGMQLSRHVLGEDEWSQPPAVHDAAAGEFVFDQATAGGVLQSLFPRLRAGAELQFLLAHPQSWPTAKARAVCVEAEFLFVRNRSFPALLQLLRLPVGSSEDTVQQAAVTLHRAISELRQAAASGVEQGHGEFLHAALSAIGSILAERRGGASGQLLSEAVEAESQLRSYATAMEHESNGALDEAGMENVVQQARDAGFTRVEFEPALLQDVLQGWLLLLHRP